MKICIIFLFFIFNIFSQNLYCQSFNADYKVFKKHGFKLNRGINKSYLAAIIADSTRHVGDFQKQPYSAMYMAFGLTINDQPFVPVSDNCWTYDSSALNSNIRVGIYVLMVANLCRISNGELEIMNLKDDMGMETVVKRTDPHWVSFDCHRKNYKWIIDANSDSLKKNLLWNMEQLCHELNTSGRFTILKRGGKQGYTIGWCKPKAYEKIRQDLHLQLIWLNDYVTSLKKK